MANLKSTTINGNLNISGNLILGWKLIFNNRLVKLEKIPAKAESFMGISEFKDTMDNCICGSGNSIDTSYK